MLKSLFLSIKIRTKNKVYIVFVSLLYLFEVITLYTSVINKVFFTTKNKMN